MKLRLNALPSVAVGSLVVVVCLWLLLMGSAHADDDQVSFRTITVDGLKVRLLYTRVVENGREVLCQDYVKDVVNTPAEGKTDITLGTHCEPKSVERFTL